MGCVHFTYIIESRLNKLSICLFIYFKIESSKRFFTEQKAQPAQTLMASIDWEQTEKVYQIQEAYKNYSDSTHMVVRTQKAFYNKVE